MNSVQTIWCCLGSGSCSDCSDSKACYSEYVWSCKGLFNQTSSLSNRPFQAMESAMKSMNLEKVQNLMDRFEKGSHLFNYQDILFSCPFQTLKIWMFNLQRWRAL